MDERILKRLCSITAEEKEILEGRTTIDRDIYTQKKENVVSGRKLLSAGKLITVRPHTRFIHFPAHTHDYVEMVYMCQGSTRHKVNGKEIILKKGELLFLNQSAIHEVYRAGEGDVAVNFIVLPSFFSSSLGALGNEETPVRRFLVDCLCGQNSDPGYLYFKVSDHLPIENLMENLLWTLLEKPSNKREISQMTMSLVFLQLLGQTEKLLTENGEEAAVIKVLRIVETDYPSASLSEIAKTLHYDLCWLSREIKRKTGKTFTTLLQEKRMAQAAFLLRNTKRNVADISTSVGYENISYFHRIFAETFSQSPKQYRDMHELQERTLFRKK